jgi:hypothetical protein
MRDAFAHGVSEVTINTCTLDHPAALPMYQRFGFQPVRRETRQVEVPGHMTVPRHVAAQIVP